MHQTRRWVTWQSSLGRPNVTWLKACWTNRGRPTHMAAVEPPSWKFPFILVGHVCPPRPPSVRSTRGAHIPPHLVKDEGSRRFAHAEKELAAGPDTACRLSSQVSRWQSVEQLVGKRAAVQRTDRSSSDKSPGRRTWRVPRQEKRAPPTPRPLIGSLFYRMVRRTRDAEAELNLPPGFRFHPTDEELVVAYLCRKVAHQCLPVPIIAEVDLYKYDPWLLPDKALFGSREWYFFTPRDRKYPNGSRPNRAAGSGYWKATGADKPVTPAGCARPLGIKKALVFYAGKAPKGAKTNWIMHEYRLADTNRAANKKGGGGGSLRLDDWVLCRLYNKKNNWERTQQHQEEEMSPGETMDSFEAAGDTGSESLRTPESDVENDDYTEEHDGVHHPFTSAPQVPNTVMQAPRVSAMAGGMKEENNDWFMDLHLDDLQSSLIPVAGAPPLDLSYPDCFLLGLASPQLKPGQNYLPPF